jgi:hypothetical protein
VFQETDVHPSFLEHWVIIFLFFLILHLIGQLAMSLAGIDRFILLNTIIGNNVILMHFERNINQGKTECMYHQDYDHQDNYAKPH